MDSCVCGENDILKFRQRNIKGKLYFVRQCRACEARQSKKYAASHKKERAEYQKKYFVENKDIVSQKKQKYDKNRYPIIKNNILEYQKEYRKSHKNIINACRRKEDSQSFF